ncbi:MAG: type-F conjugative transfer system pilin assembly protein TraF [Proteobacteria bacterium]|nr:type-F conjugative transfer system pilin assembly protein TraF [Pseudomonadota bacterium]
MTIGKGLVGLFGIVFGFMLLPFFAYADFSYEEPQGFHWYTQAQQPKPKQEQKKLQTPQSSETVSTVPQRSPYQQLQYLSMQTKNTLATALLNPTVENTTKYMYAQQFWAKQDQKFVRSWQQALLQNPDLDYSLNFPTDNNAIPVRNDEQNLLVEKTVQSMSKNFGLLFFYRGNSSICQKFASMILMPLVNQYHFSMISVTTDDQPIIGLPNPKSIPLSVVSKVLPMKAKYMPALFLVNLKTKQMQALSYGFIAGEDLKVRFLDVVNNFQRYSYQGIREQKQ